MRNREPLISFTFDDFPRSALSAGGRILEEHGIAGTYYTSLGLMGAVTPTGEMFEQEDLWQVGNGGHELGCHTYAHCHAGETPAAKFEQSIKENRNALEKLMPGVSGFQTLSYPIGMPWPATKRRCARYFAASRAGGQIYNAGTLDLDLLSAFFLEQSRDHPEAIRGMIDKNSAAGGWLIFATHDVCRNPTRYGCTPALFEEIVRHSVESGARVLPVSAALQVIGVAHSGAPATS